MSLDISCKSHISLKNKIQCGLLQILLGTLLGTNLFVCVEVLGPSQPNGVMSSAVSLPSHTFTGQA